MRQIDHAVDRARASTGLVPGLSLGLFAVDCKVALRGELAAPDSPVLAAAGVGVQSGATPALGGDCRQSLVLAPIVAAGVAPDLHPGFDPLCRAVFSFAVRAGNCPLPLRSKGDR